MLTGTLATVAGFVPMATLCAQITASTQLRETMFVDGRLSIPPKSEMLRHVEWLIFTAMKIRLMIDPLEDEHRALPDIVDGLLMRFRVLPRFALFADETAAVLALAREFDDLIDADIRPALHKGVICVVRSDGYLACETADAARIDDDLRTSCRS